MISRKKLGNSNLQSSFRSDLPDESSSHKTNPIVNQIKLLNQQNIQVRRPSDITAEQRLESISSAQQGIQQSKTIPEEDNKLNLINEESSLKEQSHHLQSSLKKSIISQIQDPLLESDYYSRELLIRKPVSWDTLYTVVSENKQLKILPIEIINDNCTPHSTTQLFHAFAFHQIFNLIFSLTYLSLLSVILFGVANNDYNLVYQLEIQLILLILPAIQLVVSYYLDGGLTLKDLLIVTIIVPFMVYLIDSNKTNITAQLIYWLMMIKIKENILKIKLIIISQGYYIYYWFIIKLLQLHFYQQFLGILIAFIIKPKLQIYNTLTYILKTDESNFGAYILQLITISFICCYTSKIVVEFTSLFRFDTAITEQLIQLSTSLGTLPQQRKIHHLEKQLKDFNSLLLIETIQQDQIDEQSKQTIFEFKYREQMKELPIFHSMTKHCLNDILHVSKEQVYQPNQIIYHPNSLNQSLYLLVQGEVEVFQENGQQIFNIAKFNKKKAFNQAGFFLGQSTDVGLRSLTYSKILEIPFGEFHREMAKHPQDLEKFKMSQDKLTFCKAYESIDQRCYVCHHHHLLNNCHHVHYIPKKRFLIDYINSNTSNYRSKFERKRTKKYHNNTRNNQQNLEFVALNYRHLMQYSSEVSNIPQKRPKTITSIALHIENEDELALAQQIQSLSPVQMIAQGSSMSSYPFLPQQQPSESRSKVQFQEGQQSYKKYVKDSFVVHRKRQRDKRQSYAPEFERESQAESLQKYATVQDRRKSVNDSNDDRSKIGVQQSSKFTGETSKQFMQSPLEIPLYDDQSFESNHQFSDYFPQHNINQALQSYRVYQDSVLSSQKNNQQ